MVIKLNKTHLLDTKDAIQGIVIALIILGLWGISLTFLLFWEISHIHIVWLLLAFALQTFLYTGLFITAHDAIHCSLFPQNPKINHFIGALAAFFYALFPYQKLLKNHWLHHHHPATETDPDFHDGKHKNPFLWYLHFIKKYLGWQQIFGLIIAFNSLKYFSIISEENLLLFWVIPSILSSFQLFYFGIFLPHREPEGGYKNTHRAQSNSFPPFWSFITCYHFGYHEEHHEFPDVPWWQLPVIRKR